MADVSDEKAAALRSWFEERVGSGLFSGTALVWREGVAAFEYAGGLAHRGHAVPVTSPTRFGVASITKLVTAVTALRLVEQGEVGLHAPILDVLPVEQHTAAMTPEHTLHHLLSHTSGLPNYHDGEAQDWGSFTAAWDRVPPQRARGPAALLPLLVDLPAVAPPGAEYRYADANFIVAGLVIEAVTGRPFGDVAAEEVLVPTGMAASGFEHLDAEPAGLATGYLVDAGPPAGWRSNLYSVPAGGMPDGGLFTTASDLAGLIDALVAGRLLGEPLLAAMTHPTGPASDQLEQYGYGCELVVEDGAVTILGHNGHDPGVSGIVSHFVADGTTVVVLCNHDRGSWPATQHLTDVLGLHDPRT